MLAEEWEHIKLVFETALKLPEDERPSYVESACPDPQHREVVTELLRNHAGAGRFLESVTVRIRHHVFSRDQLVASRFRIVRLIGDGGMGEVYEASDERLQVRVALKTLRPELTSDPRSLDRFRREILVAREVSHESLCKIFDLVEHASADGAVVPCLTMQLIEGESLLKYLQTRRPLSPEQALPMIRQIAGAIDALHSHEIVHRDLKPSNIMLTTRNGALRAVVTDFGLAKPITHTDGGFFESKLEFQAGAPYFMAPELLRDGRPSPASDIYALGLIVDEMVTETRAFPAESLHSLYYQKLWDAPIPPTARSRSLQPPWERVILRCLAADAADRYPRAMDAVSDLERPETASIAPVPPVLKPVEAETPQPAARRQSWKFLSVSRRVRITLVAVALIVACAIAAARSLAEPGKSSLVVFPIENLANRPDLNYLCKGIGAELMRRLTLIDGVQVIPYYEPRAATRIDQLKGRYSLEGLLQATGNRVRLTAQLTENRDGTLLWSRNFERDIQNPLQLQSDIAEGSVEALQMGTLFGRPVGISGAGLQLPSPLLKLLGFQKVAVPRSATTSSAAFDYYVRGQYLFEERTVPAALNAIHSYENALREDPDFALAKAALADAQLVLMDYEYEPESTLLARARGFAGDAVRLDPNLAEAYTSLASVRQAEWDFAGAEQSYRTALRLNPRFSRAHRWYAGLIMQFGRYDESLEEMRRAVELDPYDYSAQSNQGAFLYFARRYREASAKLEETLAHKDLISAHIGLGDVYSQLGLESSGADAQANFARAIQQADLVENVVRRNMSQSPPPSGALTIMYADRMHAEYYIMSGRPESARPYLERMIADTAAGRISPGDLGRVYGVAGDADKAMPLLEKAAERKERMLPFLKVSPQSDRLRGDPRFQALLKNIGIQ
jgi:serine/threonine protein kinase/TolB-like protein/tetratricopeptide (TPR) repeat protein